MPTIDLNADLGEGFGAWRMGDDAALLRIVSSANVACGFHAGDPDIMAQCFAQAKQAESPSGPMFHFPILRALAGAPSRCRRKKSSAPSPTSWEPLKL